MKLTKTALAKKLGCSRSTLHTWELAGCPVNDVAAAERWVALNGVGSDASAPQDLKRKIAEKRLAILEQQRIAAVRDNQERNGELMPVTDAKRQNGEAWAFVFAALDQLCNEAPPSMAGLDSVTIFKKLSDFRERMRKEAKQKFEQAA